MKRINKHKAKQSTRKETCHCKKRRKPGIWAGQVIIKEDFDLLPPDFYAEFLDTSQTQD